MQTRTPPFPAVNGRLLRVLRERKGLTRTELARQVGVSGSWIGRVERTSQSMRPDAYLRLCEVLGVRYEALLRPDMRPDEQTLAAATSGSAK